MSKTITCAENYIMTLENVENHLCGLERESDSKNLRNRQSQLWKRYQTTVDSGGVGNLTPEDSSALLLVGNES